MMPAIKYIQVCLVIACVVTSNGVYLAIACLSWKQHATGNYVGPKGTTCKMPRGANKIKCIEAR